MESDERRIKNLLIGVLAVLPTPADISMGSTSYLEIENDNRRRIKKLIIGVVAVLLVVSTISFASLVTGHRERTDRPERTTTQHSLRSPNFPREILRSVCSRTHHSLFCFSISFPAAKNPTTLKEAVEILINRTVRSVQNLHSMILKLISSGKDLNSRQKGGLNNCLEMLETTTDALRTASQDLKNFPSKDLFFRQSSYVKTLLSAAMTNQDTCLEGLSDGKNYTLRHYLKNRLVPISLMLSDSLAMVKNLEDEQTVWT